MSSKPEVWLRGPLEGVTPLLQPVAHALLQAREELAGLLTDFPPGSLNERPAGLATPAFHLQHLTGVLDRLFTYARGEQLSEVQLKRLAAEEKAVGEEITVSDLLNAFHLQVEFAIKQLKQTDEHVLTEMREVGRGRLPSTVIGLYIHAAEHTMRHIGQLLVTVRILKNAAR